MYTNNLTATAHFVSDIWEADAPTLTETGAYSISADRSHGELRVLLTNDATCTRVAAVAQVREDHGSWGKGAWMTLDMSFFEMDEIVADNITEWADRAMQTAINQTGK